MNKFWVVLSHTYLTRLKSKPFIITTVIALFFIVGLSNLQSIIGTFKSDETEKYAIIDHTESLFTPLEQDMVEFNDEIELIPFSGTEEEGEQAIRDGKYEALIILDMNEADLLEA